MNRPSFSVSPQVDPSIPPKPYSRTTSFFLSFFEWRVAQTRSSHPPFHKPTTRQHTLLNHQTSTPPLTTLKKRACPILSINSTEVASRISHLSPRPNRRGVLGVVLPVKEELAILLIRRRLSSTFNLNILITFNHRLRISSSTSNIRARINSIRVHLRLAG